uniref:Ig-like domain-containing protein n=1 Tax=Nannospalax galili TaxID=1026970 RepID=A0A8C6RQS2_NANGA
MLWSLFLPLLWTGSLAQDQRYQLTVPKSVTVQEGLCVLVPCRVIYPFSLYSPHPVFGYWFKKGANIHHGSPVATNDPQKPVHTATKNRFLLLGDPQKQNCSLFIRDAQKRDAGMYFFRVEGDPSVRYSYGESQLSVHDTEALTKIPDILIPPTLEPGQSINLTCSVPWACERGTPPIFSWMSVALTSLGPRTTLSSVLTLTGRPQDHGTNLTCQVTFPGAGVTVERTVQLNVTSTSGMVLAAIGGAGVTALLFVGLCLIFFTQQQDSSVHSPPGNPSSSQEAPAHLHYASLVFHGSRPWFSEI